MSICAIFGLWQWVASGVLGGDMASIADSEDGCLESLDKVQMSHGTYLCGEGVTWYICSPSWRSCSYQKLWHIELVQEDRRVYSSKVHKVN